jgi:CRP/FNR family cyclic AMP-dependent transcriptional regulator
MKIRDNVQDRLAASPLFRSCSKREIAAIASLTTQVDVTAGTLLTAEGEAGRECGFILEGTAAVQHDDEVVALLGPGDHYGEMALLDAGPRTATIVAQTPMTLAVMSAREFDELLYRVPAVGRRIMRSLSERLRDAELDAAS